MNITKIIVICKVERHQQLINYQVSHNNIKKKKNYEYRALGKPKFKKETVD